MTSDKIIEQPQLLEKSVTDWFKKALENFDQANIYSEEEIKQLIYQLEISLRKNTKLENNDESKILLHLLKEPISDTVIFEANPTECIIFEYYNQTRFVQLLYSVFPNRKFKTLDGQTITGFKDIALYAVKDNNFSNPYINKQIECYFKANNRSFQFKQNLSEFVVACFEDEITYQFEVVSIKRRRPYEYEAHYNVLYDLPKVLCRHNVIAAIEPLYKQSGFVTLRRILFEPAWMLTDSFCVKIKKEHREHKGRFVDGNKRFIRKELIKQITHNQDGAEYRKRHPFITILIIMSIFLLGIGFYYPILIKEFFPLRAVIALLTAGIIRKVYYYARVIYGDFLRYTTWWLSALLIIYGVCSFFRHTDFAIRATKYRHQQAKINTAVIKDKTINNHEYGFTCRATYIQNHPVSDSLVKYDPVPLMDKNYDFWLNIKVVSRNIFYSIKYAFMRNTAFNKAVSRNTKVEIISLYRQFYLVRFQSKLGYIHANEIVRTYWVAKSKK